MSAFYRSVESASEYIYGLGVTLEDYLFIDGDAGCNVKFYACLEDEAETISEALFKSSPFEKSIIFFVRFFDGSLSYEQE